MFPYASADGLRLVARKFSGSRDGAGTVLCLHGLTRNSRDFAELAAELRGEFHVLAPDQRGRGQSAYDPVPLNYNLLVQSQDMWTLLDHCGVEKCVVVGTSMGALMAVVMANQNPGRIVALVLNDAGPEVDPKGVARIRSYVGQGGPIGDWDAAAAALKAVHGGALPTYGEDDWARLARATYVEGGSGLRLDYDPALASVFASDGGAPPDMWPAFAVVQSIPTLVIRGALSDILSAETVAEMGRRFPTVTVATIDHRGHAPDLTEPAALAAIHAFLARPEVRARWRAA